MVPHAIRVGAEIIAVHGARVAPLPGAAGVGHKRRSPCVESSHLTRTPVTATKGTPTMATDYDAPRRTESDDATEHSLDELTKRRNDAAASVIDVDETDTTEGFEPARPASWSTTVTATPANAQASRSAATARRNRGPRVARTGTPAGNPHPVLSSRRPQRRRPVSGGGEHSDRGEYAHLLQSIGLVFGAVDQFIEVGGIEAGIGVGEVAQCTKAGGFAVHAE